MEVSKLWDRVNTISKENRAGLIQIEKNNPLCTKKRDISASALTVRCSNSWISKTNVSLEYRIPAWSKSLYGNQYQPQILEDESKRRGPKRDLVYALPRPLQLCTYAVWIKESPTDVLKNNRGYPFKHKITIRFDLSRLDWKYSKMSEKPISNVI